uniref:Small nuclear RNA activating complex polypeptide 2 n=1 Tax=Poecilia formosa TaxID=48698 RepID=A0A096MEQ0_POEFO
MKPPPRNRTKRELSSWTETPKSCRKTNCLKALSQTTRGGLQEIDYAVLKKDIPTRSISEISAMVDSLKNNIISSARFQLRMKNWQEKQFRRPIEEWTHMASTLAGTLEKVISAAFSQMLVVSSTEPCTLRNCEPKQDPRPAAACRPVPCVGCQNSNQEDPPTLPVSSFSSPHSTVPLSNTAAELPATSGQSSKHAAVDGPETVGVNFAVDFEKIYKFLSVVQNPSKDYNLTPMESAIVLDLLMSLPEELHYLDCKNLQKHLIQMHQSLSAPHCSMPAKQLMSKEAETGDAAGRGATSSGQSEDADMSDFLPPLNPFLVPLSLLMRKMCDPQR